MSYPRWRYFPSYAAPPDWVEPLASIFEESRPQLDSAVVHSKRMESNDVLRVLAKGLIGMDSRSSRRRPRRRAQMTAELSSALVACAALVHKAGDATSGPLADEDCDPVRKALSVMSGASP
jgi:hypothetical protein